MINLIMLTTDPVAQAGGYTIAMVGYLVVFMALFVLIGIFILIPMVIQYFVDRRMSKSNKPVEKKADMDANINVAIALGLHLYLNELHDEESNIITIRNAQKQYSPWSSKIYGVTNVPVKQK